MDSSQEGCRIFRIPGGNAAPLLQMKESILNQVPSSVDLLIVSALRFAILL